MIHSASLLCKAQAVTLWSCSLSWRLGPKVCRRCISRMDYLQYAYTPSSLRHSYQMYRPLVSYGLLAENRHPGLKKWLTVDQVHSVVLNIWRRVGGYCSVEWWVVKKKIKGDNYCLDHELTSKSFSFFQWTLHFVCCSVPLSFADVAVLCSKFSITITSHVTWRWLIWYQAS